MKKIKIFKSGFGEKLKLLLIPIGLLVTGLTSLVWAYNCNYANVYYDNSVTQWTYVQLLYENSGGSTGWNMSHVAHTDLYWKAPGAWSDNNFSGVRFADGTNADWNWSSQKSWNRTGYASVECTGFFGGDIANNVHLFTCNIKTTDGTKVNIGHPYYGTDPTILNKTVNVGSKTKVGNNDFSASVASVAAISMKHYSFNSSTYASVQDYYSSNVPTHPKGSTSTYAIYPTYTSNVTYSFSNLTSGYEFVGWYDGEGNFLSKNEEYTVYTTSNYDIYAYFAQTHTVNISAGTGGEVSVSGDQTIGQNGLEVTATPNTGYKFDSWEKTDGISLSSTDATMTITATASGTVTAKFVPIWTIKGSDTEMGNWSEVEDNDLIYVSGTTFSTTIALAADHIYEFKVYNRNSSGSWYGYGSSNKEVTFTRGGTKSQSDLATDKGGNLGITTDVAGDYIFTWNTTGNVISVTYPTPSYTISYKDQGNADFTGTQTDPPTTHTYGTATTLKIPMREGYDFAGWWTDAACTETLVGTTSAATLAADGYTDNITLYAKWTDTHLYYYKGASPNEWSTASNWTRNAVPGSTDDVIVLTALNAPSGTTTVNSVRIATSGTYTPVGGSGITANGSLTIPGSAALKVVTNVANCTISANAPTSGTSTTSSTLNIGYGGALVWGTAGTPGDATVGFYTPSGGVAGSQDAVNDYIGIPFTSLSSDAYYNAWVFAVSGDTWAEISGADMSPWTGYNIIEKKEKGESAGGSYSLTGTLVANNATVSGGATAGTETLYANSWVAPIEISKMSITGTATVYLFRPTSFNDIEDAADPLGNYDTYPVNSSSGVYIPSMKSFSVVSSTASVNYATAVYGEVSGAFSAPRRERKADYRQAIWDTQDTLFVTVKSASGWGDVLKMFIHEDFSQDYENGWDGPKMEGMWEAPKLYTLNNEGEMAVSCVPNADNSVIAFHAGTASNEYTFTFKYSGEDELILKDTKTGVETPIEDGGTYEFTSNTSDDDLRFVIKKVSNAATGVDEIGGNASGVQKIMYNGTMYILREGRIYSAEGAFVK